LVLRSKLERTKEPLEPGQRGTAGIAHRRMGQAKVRKKQENDLKGKKNHKQQGERKASGGPTPSKATFAGGRHAVMFFKQKKQRGRVGVRRAPS